MLRGQLPFFSTFSQPHDHHEKGERKKSTLLLFAARLTSHTKGASDDDTKTFFPTAKALFIIITHTHTYTHMCGQMEVTRYYIFCRL